MQELARRTSHEASAVDEALAVLDRMHASTDAAPDTAIYNLVLEVHAFSRRNEAAEKAAALVARMEQEADTSTASSLPRPNSDTYATLMDAYMQQKSSSSMEKIEGLVERLRSTGDGESNDNILVDTTILNKLIQAHGRQGDAEAALGILEDMLSHINDSDKMHQRPNQKSWVHVLRAYAAKGNVTAVEELMERMMQQQQPPDDESTTTAAPPTAAYNALLQAHAKNGDTHAAERLLYRMLDDSSSDSDDETAVPRPDHDSFYYVMQAYSRSRPKPGLVFKVERLLALQEAVQQQQQKDDTFTPAAEQVHPPQPNNDKINDRILQAAVMAMARDTSDPLKAVKAARLVERIEDAPGRRRPYSCLLNACAYTLPHRVTEPHDKLAIWQIALDAFNHLLKDGAADSRVYGQLLRTAHHLLPPGRKRDAVAERVFQQCCLAGLVDSFVWTEYERVASDDLMLQQLGGFFEDGVEPPDEWSRNVEVVSDDDDDDGGGRQKQQQLQ